MSVFKRLSQVFQQKTNAALDKVEDPTQALDLSYQKMMENLQQVRRSIADVLTSQKRLEAQKAQLQSQYEKLQGQARQALQQGQDDLARTALERAQGVKGQVDALAPQIDQLRAQEESHLPFHLREETTELGGRDRPPEVGARTSRGQVGASHHQVLSQEGLLEGGADPGLLEETEPPHGPPPGLRPEGSARGHQDELGPSEVLQHPRHGTHVPVLLGAVEDHRELRRHGEASPVSGKSRPTIQAASKGRSSS